MPTLVGLALLILATNLDVEGGATVEVRRGSAPVNAFDPPHSASVSVVTPEAGVLLSQPDGYLRLRYFPALSSVFLDGQSGIKLYVLHQADLTAQLRSGRRVTWNLRATGATGDTDYTALAQLLGKTQGQLPTVTGFTTATGLLSATVALNRRSLVETSLDFLHRAPLGQSPGDVHLFPDCPPPAPLPVLQLPPPAPGGTVPANLPPPFPAQAPVFPPPNPAPPVLNFPTEDTLTLTPDLIHASTRRDTVDFRTGFGSLWLSTGLQMLSVAPHLGWSHFFDRNTSFRLGVGLVYTDLVKRAPRGCGPPPPDLPGVTLNPVADVAVSTVLYKRRELLVAANVNAAATWYFDPVLSRAGAIGSVGVQLAAIMPPKWSVRVEASFSTSLTAHPIAGNPDESVFTSVLPIRYQITRQVYFEFGGRWADRGPHLEAENFRFHRRELWIYTAVGGTFGTARGAPRTSSAGAGSTPATAEAVNRDRNAPASGSRDLVPPDVTNGTINTSQSTQINAPADTVQGIH